MPKKKANKKSKKRTRLTREAVIQAAVSLADQDGVESLTMRALGSALRVEAMSLYNHVENKDDLLDGMVDLVAGQIAVPAIDGDWQAALRKRAISAREVLLRHPWAPMLFLSRINVGPNMLRYVDATVGCLRNAGFSWATTDHAWNAIDNHIYGFTLQELNFPFEPEQFAEAAEAFLPMLPVDRYPHLHGMSMQIIERTHDGLQDFEFGLNLIVEGLERRLRNQETQ